MPPSARSNQPLRVAIAPVKLPRSWPKSSESTSSGGMAPQLTRMIGPAARAEPAVDRAGDDLLAGAGLAQDQHGGVGGRHVLDALHHLAQARLDPRRCDVAAGGSAVQQGAVLRLGGFAEAFHLPNARVVAESGRKGLGKAHEERALRPREDGTRLHDRGQDIQRLGRLLAGRQGGEKRAIDRRLLREQRDEVFREDVAPFGGMLGAVPRQQGPELCGCRGSSRAGREGSVPARRDGSDGLDGRGGDLQAADPQPGKGKRRAKAGGDELEKVGQLQMTTDLSPDFQ